MRILRFISKPLRRWQQQRRPRRGIPSRSVMNVSTAKTLSAKQKPSKSLHLPVMFLLVVISLTSVVGYRFYNQPQLAVGTISPVTIEAPYTAKVEDRQTTEENRKAARRAVIPILKLDTQINQQIYEELDKFLTPIEELRQQAVEFPFIPAHQLSLSSQARLRDSTQEEWLAVLGQLDSPNSLNILRSSQPRIERSFLNPSLQKAIQESQAYGQATSQAQLEELLQTIGQVRHNDAETRQKLSQELLLPLSEAEILTLLDLSENSWTEFKSTLYQTTRRILSQGISPGLPSSVIENAIEIQLKNELSSPLESLGSQLLVNVLKPNLIEDKEEIKRRAEQAAQAVNPTIVSIQSSEVIVAAGEKITQEDFVLLDYFSLSRREVNWLGLAGCTGLVSVAVGIFWLVERQLYPRLRRRDHVLLLLLSLSAPLLLVFDVPYTNLAAIGLLVSSFYRPSLAVTLVSILMGLMVFSSVGISHSAASWEYVLPGGAGGILAAALAGKMRSREELAFLGGAVGLTQGSLNLMINLISSAAAQTIFYAILPQALLFGLSGIAWCVFALGVSPYLERLFDLVTPIRLAELSNPNRPLLKRLATEAPGTFQHTLFVSSLAEAAARELHCNVELVRAGTLYHDIGKMHDPLGFIENQMGRPNKHDEINDPWKSAEIIKKHVTEGLAIARRYGLPKAVRDFIPEHQGTLLISYFYFQAKQRGGDSHLPILESDFRYEGPTPQSRETGIVILADGCEAALRSLKEATPEVALSVVKKIIKARWDDQQLVDSGLKWEELPIIADVFIRVWQQYNHQRIAYPKAALEPQPSPQV